ncbi:MAG: hypothetical protein H5U40_05970 [Polyangiaceae bacterium]|nr:hypothetical protein [Polyangiaceae bacterium]
MPDIEAALAPIRSYASSLRVGLVHADGLPLDGAGRPLAPLLVRVSSRDMAGVESPAAGVPLRLAGDVGTAFAEVEGTTDATGQARFALRSEASMPSSVAVEVNAAALFGVLATELSLDHAKVQVRTRARGLARAAFHVTERPAGGQRVAAGLRRAFSSRPGAVFRLVDERDARSVLATTGEARAATVRSLASRFDGRIDVFVLGEVDSEFASRMGAHSVWYEARFRGEVYDLWTGERLAALEVEATASGLGDSRADQAARTALAERLAEQLFTLDRPAPTPAPTQQASR